MEKLKISHPTAVANVHKLCVAHFSCHSDRVQEVCWHTLHEHQIRSLATNFLKCFMYALCVADSGVFFFIICFPQHIATSNDYSHSCYNFFNLYITLTHFAWMNEESVVFCRCRCCFCRWQRRYRVHFVAITHTLPRQAIRFDFHTYWLPACLLHVHKLILQDNFFFSLAISLALHSVNSQ